MSALLRCRRRAISRARGSSATILVRQVLEGLASGRDRPGDVASAVDPVDRHRALAAVAEAVWDAGRHPGRLAGDQGELIVPDHGRGLALVYQDGLLDVVRVQWDAGAGREDRHAGGDPVLRAVPLADERDRRDSVAAVEALHLLRAQHHRGRDGSAAHADSSAVWVTSSEPVVLTWPTSTRSATVRHCAKCGAVLWAANASASRYSS